MRAATTRWTATTAGTASSGVAARSCSARASRRTERHACDRGVLRRRRRPTSSSLPTLVVAPARAASIRDGDAVIFFNFRPDRAREITRAFIDPDVRGVRRPVARSVRFVCLTEYDPTIPAPVAFPKDLPRARARRRPRRGRPAPAPHRRDREVRARDVLLQRRRGDAESRARSASSSPARRSPPTTCSPR